MNRFLARKKLIIESYLMKKNDQVIKNKIIIQNILIKVRVLNMNQGIIKIETGKRIK